MLRRAAAARVMCDDDAVALTVCPECRCADLLRTCWFCGGAKEGSRIITFVGSSVTWDQQMDERPV